MVIKDHACFVLTCNRFQCGYVGLVFLDLPGHLANASRRKVYTVLRLLLQLSIHSSAIWSHPDTFLLKQDK